MASGTADLCIYGVIAWAKLCSHFYSPSDLSWIITFPGNIFQFYASITSCITGTLHLFVCTLDEYLSLTMSHTHTLIHLRLVCQAHGKHFTHLWINEWMNKCFIESFLLTFQYISTDNEDHHYFAWPAFPLPAMSQAHHYTHRSGEQALRWLQAHVSLLGQFPLTTVFTQITDHND